MPGIVDRRARLPGAAADARVVQTQLVAEVPVQYLQSFIAIELAVTGALLFQIRYFDRNAPVRSIDGSSPPWLLVSLGIVLVATLFGSLWALLHGAEPRRARSPSGSRSRSCRSCSGCYRLSRGTRTRVRGILASSPTIVGLLAYVVVVAGVVVLLNV